MQSLADAVLKVGSGADCVIALQVGCGSGDPTQSHIGHNQFWICYPNSVIKWWNTGTTVYFDCGGWASVQYAGCNDPILATNINVEPAKSNVSGTSCVEDMLPVSTSGTTITTGAISRWVFPDYVDPDLMQSNLTDVSNGGDPTYADYGGATLPIGERKSGNATYLNHLYQRKLIYDPQEWDYHQKLKDLLRPLIRGL